MEILVKVRLVVAPGYAASSYTATEAIKSAAAAGLALVQPDRYGMRLTDKQGREYSHWAAGDTLYLRRLD